MRKIYLDYAATTYIDSKILNKMLPFLKENFGNPSSLYLLGRRAKIAINDARQNISRILNVNSEEIIFTGSGTESDNLAIFGVALFSRQQENITHQYPDIIDGLKKSFIGKEAIIEGEVVAYDEAGKKLLPFQVLMSRRRKHNIEEYAKKIPIRYFLFDLLYLNGKNSPADNAVVIHSPLL